MTYLAFLRDVRPEVDSVLGDLLPPASEPPGRLHAAMRHAVLGGGKRVRPSLTLLAAEALGSPRQSALAPAAAMELVHAFSLVHDDLPALDDDDLRRGRPTVHRAFDEATAVLVGDALLNLGLLVLARRVPEPRAARAVALVAEAVGSEGMIGGQMDDLEAERSWPADPEGTLERIHRRKTGALLTASIRLGGLCAEADDGIDAALKEFGEVLGLRFQIADDILDVEGSEGRIGKTVGKDAEARKLTYVSLYGVEESRRRLEECREAGLALAAELPRTELFASLVSFVCDRDR